MLTRGVALSACTDATLLAVVEGNYSTPNKALIHDWLVASARREMHKRLRWRLPRARLFATEYARRQWRLECASHATG